MHTRRDKVLAGTLAVLGPALVLGAFAGLNSVMGSPPPDPNVVLLVVLFFGWPLMLALPLVVFAQAPRAARLEVGLHGMNWHLRAGHLRAWATLPASLSLVGAFAWIEWIVRSILLDPGARGSARPGRSVALVHPRRSRAADRRVGWPR